ncbi:MAG: lipopolysaccharide biosynthesis protein [Desulfuromonadales bacterium]|nr:lipopolysaccharide biosynthesis protein [Desulfuromonadales bacterium]
MTTEKSINNIAQTSKNKVMDDKDVVSVEVDSFATFGPIERDKSRLLKNGVWIASGQGFAALATLGGVRLITELASPSLFGSFVLLNGLLNLVQGILFQPLAQAALRYYPEFSKSAHILELRRHMSTVFRLRWFCGLAVMTGLALIDITTTHYLTFTSWLLLAAALGIEGWKTVELVMRNAARNQKAYSAFFIADSLARPIGAVLAAYFFNVSVELLLLGQTLGTFLVLVSFSHFSKSRIQQNRAEYPLDVVLNERLTKGMAQFAAPLLWTSLVCWFSAQADRYIVGGMIGIAQAGIYAAAYGLTSRPLLMIGTANEATLRQVLYTAVSRGDRRGMLKASCVWLGLNLAMSTIIASLIVIFSEPIVRCLLAEPYRETSISLIPWLVFGHVPLLAAQAIERLLYAVQRTHAVLFVQAISACVSIIVAVLGATWAGLIGVAVAVPVYYSLQLLMTLWIAFNSIKDPIYN